MLKGSPNGFEGFMEFSCLVGGSRLGLANLPLVWMLMHLSSFSTSKPNADVYAQVQQATRIHLQT